MEKNSAQRFYPWKEFASSLLDESKNAADWQLWHLSPKTVSKAQKEMAREWECMFALRRKSSVKYF